ncbi:MAG: alpha/beta hydrolase [Clostridium sp.]|nr:alpha/beta hydrolase [Clostridium sp.]
MKNGYIKCNSANIYYEVYGTGETILFLHGNGEDLTYFKPQIDYFKDKYKLVLIDSRGHGKSSFGNEGLTLDLMCDDVFQVLDKLNLNNVNILGFSDGGNIALKMALKDQSKIKTLTLMGANLKPGDIVDEEQILIKYEYRIEKEEKNKKILELMINEPNIDYNDLEKIKVKTLVVAGEKDAIKEECTKRIANSIENSKLEILEGADHFLSSKMPEVFNNIYSKFLCESN